MNKTTEFYVARADEAAREASTATLKNVRDRALRSENAWRMLANKAMTVEANRSDKAKGTEANRIAAPASSDSPA